MANPLETKENLEFHNVRVKVYGEKGSDWFVQRKCTVTVTQDKDGIDLVTDSKGFVEFSVSGSKFTLSVKRRGFQPYKRLVDMHKADPNRFKGISAFKVISKGFHNQFIILREKIKS